LKEGAVVTDNGRGEKLLYGYPERYFASLRRLEQGGELKAASEGYEGFSNRWGYQVWTLPLSFRASSRLVAVGVEMGDERSIELGVQRGRELIPSRSLTP